MPYVYILECSDGSYYTGSMVDLEKRLWEHENGIGAKYTARHLPVKLVFCEEYARVDDAYYREKEIQGWSRKKKQALIAGNYEDLVRFSRNYSQEGEKPVALYGPRKKISPRRSEEREGNAKKF